MGHLCGQYNPKCNLTLCKKLNLEFIPLFLVCAVDEEAVVLINNLVEADEEERRLNSAATEDIMLCMMSSPVGSQSNETHSHVSSPHAVPDVLTHRVSEQRDPQPCK